MQDAPTYIQIRPVELPLGEMLPWDVVDKRGILVLRRGTLIAHEEQVERLLERRVCRERTAEDIEPPAPPVTNASAFEQLQGLKTDLHTCLHSLAAQGDGASLKTFTAIAARLRQLVASHPDAVLGGLLLDHRAAYTDLHPLLVAVIGELLAQRRAVSETLRNSLCCAALTSNLGMLDLQELPSRQREPLDEGQRRAVRSHPEQSFEMLRAIGVDDEAWLNIVLNHHERGDGSGYPHGHSSPHFDQLTSIVALADNYAAMVLPRTYREGLHAQQAMREIFGQRRIRVADELAQQFVKELGVYPPGAFVTMKNGDHGLVIRRGLHSASAPVVSCFANAKRVPYAAPLIRDTGEAGAPAIVGIATASELTLPLTTLWGMTN